MKLLGFSLPKQYPAWVGIVLGIGTIVLLFLWKGGAKAINGCAGNQYYCPGVGCLSGPDKCVPANTGGPAAVFSKETFDQWPGAGVGSTPPEYGKHEGFTAECPAKKRCPDGTRTDGPCLMEFA